MLKRLREQEVDSRFFTASLPEIAHSHFGGNCPEIHMASPNGMTRAREKIIEDIRQTTNSPRFFK